MSTITVPTTLTAISSSAFGIPVANQLNQSASFIPFVPGGSTLSAAAGTATWVTIGTLTVPTWATKARIAVHMTALGASASGASSKLQIKVGSVGGPNQQTVPSSNGTGRFSTSIADLLSGISTGSQTLLISSTFIVSTLVADATSTFACVVDYLG